MMNWIPLEREDQIDFIKSQTEPSVIFKHSTRCHVSNMVMRYFEKEWKTLEGVNLYYLDLIAYRNLSNKVAETFQVHHESPQVIVVKDGECILDASHNDVSASEIIEVLSTN
jgi:bacillithiol system protein YtxJ